MSGNATLGFHPSYDAKEFGIDYGKEYHENPSYRVEQNHKYQKALHDRFGNYKMGNPDPQLTAINTGIQPLDFLNGAMGSVMNYSSDEHVWTTDKPLAHIETLADLEKMEDIDWDSNPLYLDYLKQSDEMKKLHPDLPVSSIQGTHNIDGKLSFVMHTPYTTAFRLLGERILEIMMLDEELADGIFDYLMRQYLNLWDNISKHLDWSDCEKQNMHFGDCAATMLSPSLYERFNLKIYQKLMDNYRTCTIHSCGPSTHLLDLFKEVPGKRLIQLGAGTDLTEVRKKFPESRISAYFAAPEILHNNPAGIKKKLWEMAEVLESNFDINGSSVDPETPEENIIAYLDAAMEINARYN
ncbi:MAG: uroporphyrinogen decarboxylase family protein [Planctomycetota bacterium]|jgi:hypothetical protein